MSTKIALLLIIIVIAAVAVYFYLGGPLYFSPPHLEANPSTISVKGCVGKLIPVKITISNTGGEDTSVNAYLEGVRGKVSPSQFSVKGGSEETVVVFIEVSKQGSYSGKLILEYGSEKLELPITVDGRLDDKCLLDFYQYKKTEVKAKETLVKATKSYEIYKIYYSSVSKEMVSAILVKPLGVNKPPCVFFVHGLNGKKEKFLDFMMFLASKGYASFAIDLPMHGERRKQAIALERDFIKIVTRAVFDIRRGLDYLESRGDLGNIALLGRSLGGIIGSIAIGVDSRFKAAILVITGGNISYILQESAISPPPEKRKLILESPLLPYVEPLNYIGFFSKPVQFHLGEQDNIIPFQAGLQLASKAQVKEVYTYKTGHKMPLDKIADKILDFLDKYLKAP
ncbi:MAG: hypothetical protein DRJ52_04955 [Thermoprotei archaeon]|nr:MAG: hypothetical protein DRJ52_04955 [Thermoprotei archaeon]RLE99129.1 MAG: hypothetical protein DRJ63_06250 [Thermoprotei archaeon]